MKNLLFGFAMGTLFGLIGAWLININQKVDKFIHVADVAKSAVDAESKAQHQAPATEPKKSIKSTLHGAVADGNLALVEQLLKEGAVINKKDEMGRTPLIIAALSGHLEVVRLLIGKKADVNAADNSGMTALHYAASRGSNETAISDFKIVKILIENGANKDVVSKSGSTPLTLAKTHGQQEIIDLLTK